MAHGTGSFRVVLPVAAALAALVFSVCLYFPGYLSFDSAYQFWQVRTGRYSNLSPLAMPALWSMVYPLWPSPAAMVTLHFVGYWLGVLLLALKLRQRAVARVVFLLAVGFLPPAFVIMGHLWTDASLIAAMTLAFGLTVTGLARERLGILLLALPVILYAGAVRHNSLLAIVPLCVLWADGLLPACPDLTARPCVQRRVIAIAGIAAVMVTASFSSGRVLDRTLVQQRESPWALTALYDLAGISVRAGTMVVPAFARTPGLTLEGLKTAYSAFTNVPLYEGAERIRSRVIGDASADDERAALGRAWLSAVIEHPCAYAAHRIDVTSNLFGSYGAHPEGLFFNPAPVAYRDNPPPGPPLWKLEHAFAEQVRAARGWPIFMPALYMAASAVVLLYARRRSGSLSGKVALAAAASGLLLVLPLVIAAASAELRYSGWMFTATLIGLAAALPGSAPSSVLSSGE